MPRRRILTPVLPGVKRQIKKNIDTGKGPEALRRLKPLVFISTSSLMQMTKCGKDLKKNGFIPLGMMIGKTESETLFNIGVNFLDILKCDAFVFFNSDEMTIWQCAMLGAALGYGKKVFLISDSRRFKVEEPILKLPQIEHFESWDQLLVLKFPLKERFLKKQIAGVQGWLGKFVGKRSTPYRVKRIEELKVQLGLLKREYDEKFGSLSRKGVDSGSKS